MLHNGHNVTVYLFYPCITSWLLSVYSFSLALRSTTLWHHYEFMPCQTLHIESGRSTPSWKPARCNLPMLPATGQQKRTNKQLDAKRHGQRLQPCYCWWLSHSAEQQNQASHVFWTASAPAVSGQGIAGLCLPTILTKVLVRSGRGGSRTCMEHNRWTESVLLATQLRSQAELRKDHLTNWN